MTDIDEEGTADGIERLRESGTAVKRAWAQTIEDMEAMAERRREEGWEDVRTFPAVSTAPVGKEDGDDEERFGLVYVVADNHAEEFSEAFDAGEFPRYEAYRNDVEGFVYLVTEFQDSDSGTVIMLAGQYELRNALPAVTAAEEEGVLYSHVRRLDGTHEGSFRHEEYEPLVPGADELERFVPDHGVTDQE